MPPAAGALRPQRRPGRKRRSARRQRLRSPPRRPLGRRRSAARGSTPGLAPRMRAAARSLRLAAPRPWEGSMAAVVPGRSRTPLDRVVGSSPARRSDTAAVPTASSRASRPSSLLSRSGGNPHDVVGEGGLACPFVEDVPPGAWFSPMWVCLMRVRRRTVGATMSPYMAPVTSPRPLPVAATGGPGLTPTSACAAGSPTGHPGLLRTCRLRPPRREPGPMPRGRRWLESRPPRPARPRGSSGSRR